MGQDLQKGQMGIGQLWRRAATGEAVQGVPNGAELARRAGVTLPGAKALAIAPPSVALGKVIPIRTEPKASSAEAIREDVARVRREALNLLRGYNGENAVNGRASSVALPYAEYVQATRNWRSIREQLQRKIDKFGTITALTNDEPELMRYVSAIHDSDIHTPDFDGYLKYLPYVSDMYQSCINRVGPPVLYDSIREQHAYITGSPGSGKTELLKAMILHDIQRGNACVIIDPTGNLARPVAKWPEFQGAGASQLAYFNPSLSDARRPVYNPLDASGLKADDRATLATELADILASAMGRGNWSAQAGTLASNCFRVLLERGVSDFMFLMEALVAPDNKGTPRTNESKLLHSWGLESASPAVRHFFKYEFFGGQFAPTKSSVSGKLDFLLSDPTFVETVTGKSTLSLSAEIEAGRVVIFDLGRWKNRGGMAVFGRMVLAQIVEWGTRRGPRGPQGQKHKPVYVYVDEMSRFAGPAVIEALVFLRQNGVHLIMAQPKPGDGFDPEAKQNLFATTAVKFAAGTGQKEMLAHMGAPLDATQSLKEHQFIGCWGHQAEVFKLAVRSDLADYTRSMSEEAWEAVRADQLRRYYRSREETALLPPPVAPEEQEPEYKKRPLRPL